MSSREQRLLTHLQPGKNRRLKVKESIEIEKPAGKEKPSPVASEGFTFAGLLSKLKGREWLIAVLGVVLVAAVILIISLTMNGKPACNNVTNCLQLKDQLMQQGDMVGALDVSTGRSSL